MNELLKYCKEHLAYDPVTGIIKRDGVRIADRINEQGYRRFRIGKKKYQAHRIAFLITYGYFPETVDHINTIKHDNRLCNLRAATDKQQHYNRGLTKNNTSGYKGVSHIKRNNKWLVRISLNKKEHIIGRFKCKHTAARHYNLAARMYHGAFAYTNILKS